PADRRAEAPRTAGRPGVHMPPAILMPLLRADWRHPDTPAPSPRVSSPAGQPRRRDNRGVPLARGAPERPPVPTPARRARAAVPKDADGRAAHATCVPLPVEPLAAGQGHNAGASVLLDDPDLDLGADFGVQVDGDRKNAEALDRLLEHHVAAVHLEIEALLVQPVGDVRRRDRAEQLRLLAGTRLERQRHVLERRSTPPRLQVLATSPLLGTALLLLELAYVRLRRLVREATRQQVVARVAAPHGDDVARAPQLRDVLPQDDFHVLHGPISPDPGSRDGVRPRRSS